MYRRLDLTKLGGYPFTQKDLDWMQTSYRAAFGALSGLIGEKTIVSGMVEASGSVSAGWVCIGGELIPFQAGVIGTGEFAVIETSTSLTFKDGESKIVRFEKIAQFSAGGGYQYSELIRTDSIRNTWQRFDVKEIDCDMDYLAANFDVTGLGINDRKGWAICNGANGTRSRLGRTTVAYNPADPMFQVLGATGGEKTVTLNPNQQGDILLTVRSDDGDGQSASYKSIAAIRLNGIELYPTGNSSWGDSVVIKLRNNAEPHNNMQPFSVTLPIMKL